jgi:hypothetical protein
METPAAPSALVLNRLVSILEHAGGKMLDCQVSIEYLKLFGRRWQDDCPGSGFESLLALVETSACVLVGESVGGDRWLHVPSNPPEWVTPREDEWEDEEREEEGVDGVADPVVALLRLLQAHPGGQLGRAWKEACNHGVPSLGDLLVTPQFSRVVGASGTDSRYFVAKPAVGGGGGSWVVWATVGGVEGGWGSMVGVCVLCGGAVVVMRVYWECWRLEGVGWVTMVW